MTSTAVTSFRTIGQAFIDSPASTLPASTLPASTQDGFRAWVSEQYASLIQTGHQFKFVASEPYTGAADMLARSTTDGYLQVSTLFNDSSLLPGDLNLKFRAVHDTDHIALGHTDFDYQSECEAYERIASRTGRPDFQQILFSEIVGQAAVYFLTGDFLAGPQKVVLF